MSLEKPEVIVLESQTPSAYYEHSYTYMDEGLNMRLPIKVGVFSMGSESRNPDGSRNGGYYLSSTTVPEEDLRAFIFFKRLINTCVNCGEEINHLFINLALFDNPGNTAEIKRINSQDFMKNKNEVIDKVKADKDMRTLTNKEFRRSLDNFITYRNIFTHGILCLICSNDGIISKEKFGIRYLDNHTKITVMMYVDMQLVDRYMDTYERVKDFASEYIIAKRVK